MMAGNTVAVLEAIARMMRVQVSHVNPLWSGCLPIERRRSRTRTPRTLNTCP